MNPYRLLQASFLNGWVTIIGSVLTITFGASGLLTGNLDVDTAIGLISTGIMGLGLGSKGDKIIKALNDAKAFAQ